MKYQELVLLLPCHSLEDFPLYHDGEDAEGLLAGWSALWHPALLASAESLPTWARADEPPEELGGRLFVVPTVADSMLLAGWPARARKEGACVVRKTPHRNDILAQAVADLEGGYGGVDPDLAGDFLALGFCYLQLELLTRQLHHYGNLDEVHLKNEAVAGAHAALAGQADEARGHLQTSFETLLEAREQCYPADSYLIDLTLVAETTLDDGLQRELQGNSPLNLLITGELVARLASQRDDLLAILKTKTSEGTLAVIGGEDRERDLPLLPPEAILQSILRGQELYQRHLGQPVTIYGRRRNGLTPIIPQIVSRAGISGGLLFTLDDGTFPRGDQSKVEWEGPDGGLIEAVGRVPLDANDPASFLTLPEKLGEAMDLDHLAVALFAHWPGESQPFYDDLKRTNRYAPVLGKFCLVNDFLRDAGNVGQAGRYDADQFRTPYLKQAVIRKRPEPVTAYAAYLLGRQKLEAGQTLLAVAACLSRGFSQAVWQAGQQLLNQQDDHASPLLNPPALEQPELERPVLEQPVLERPVLERPEEQVWRSDQVRQVEQHWTTCLKTLAGVIPRQQDSRSGSDSESSRGYLVFNPLSFTRRTSVTLPQWPRVPATDDPVKGPVRAAQRLDNGDVSAVVDVPAFGYAWIAREGPAAEPENLRQPLAEARPDGTCVVRNEYFEVTIDGRTGGISTTREYKRRGNRLSQQLAYRVGSARPRAGDLWQDPDETALYSTMKADSVEVTANGPALGEVTACGRLLDADAKPVAQFQQRIQAWRSSRVLVLEVTLTQQEPAKADPWNSYYAARFAWGEESSELYRSVSQGRFRTEAKRLESPYFLETASEEMRTAILTGGLPWHRLVAPDRVDVLLASRGDTQREFRLGVSLDHPHPLQAALGLTHPVAGVPEGGPQPAAGPAGWFFHLDRKNVLVTGWDLVAEETDSTPAEPSAPQRAAGFTVRLLETEGRGGTVRLRCPIPPTTASQTDFLGNTVGSVALEGDALQLPIEPHEWLQIQARW